MQKSLQPENGGSMLGKKTRSYKKSIPKHQTQDAKNSTTVLLLFSKIAKNWWRDPFLALTASGEVKRWIIATTTMKEGDVIRSHWEIPSIPGKSVTANWFFESLILVATEAFELISVVGVNGFCTLRLGFKLSIDIPSEKHRKYQSEA